MRTSKIAKPLNDAPPELVRAWQSELPPSSNEAWYHVQTQLLTNKNMAGVWPKLAARAKKKNAADGLPANDSAPPQLAELMAAASMITRKVLGPFKSRADEVRELDLILKKARALRNVVRTTSFDQSVYFWFSNQAADDLGKMLLKRPELSSPFTWTYDPAEPMEVQRFVAKNLPSAPTLSMLLSDFIADGDKRLTKLQTTWRPVDKVGQKDRQVLQRIAFVKQMSAWMRRSFGAPLNESLAMITASIFGGEVTKKNVEDWLRQSNKPARK